MTDLPLPAGFAFAGMPCGLKKNGDPDLALIVSEQACTAAALFTQNRFAAAPVLYDREVLAANPAAIWAVLINSGNANAVTGAEGEANTRRSAKALESLLGLSRQSTFVMSTGVIGVPLPVVLIESALPSLVEMLRPTADALQAAAGAIMTTDTRPKISAVRAGVGSGDITVAGIAKGAGMIHPHMATMLAAIVTDAAIPADLLDLALRRAADRSFNRISVDGDTSTNDTVVVLANGASGHGPITDAGSAAFVEFSQALTTVCAALARAIVADGEGATRFVTIEVSGLADATAAQRVANAVAISPLVKTAIYGGDANWGRILAAAGNSGVAFDPTETALWFAGSAESGPALPRLQVVAQGMPLAYDEALAAAHFAQPELVITLRLGDGPGHSTMWTCDLSHDYVTINGSYRT